MIKLPGDTDFELDDYPLYNLNRTSATYTNEMADAMRAIGLDQTQWRILGILGDRDESPVSDIARRGVIKISTLTRMLERMEKSGLVTRKPWPEDKRIIRVSLTEKGRSTLTQAYAIGASIYRAASKGVSAEEMDVFMDVLKRIRANLQRNPHVAGTTGAGDVET